MNAVAARDAQKTAHVAIGRRDHDSRADLRDRPHYNVSDSNISRGLQGDGLPRPGMLSMTMSPVCQLQMILPEGFRDVGVTARLMSQEFVLRCRLRQG
jgi:hypothetical protein